MTNPMMAVNPLLMASGQQRIPLIPSPFGPPFVDRDALPSVAPTDPRRFCVPSQFGSSVLPNMPNMLPNHGYSGWGILPSESIKAVTRRNEMIQRHHTARSELEMYTIYQQRRMEKMNAKGLAGLGVPFLYSSSFQAGSATYHGRSMLPASNLQFHRSALRHLQENPVLLATRSHIIERWGQKYRPRRGTGNQKPLDSDTESSKSQAEEKILGQMPAIPYEEDEYAKDSEIEVCHNQKSSETNEKPTPPRTNPRGALQPSQKNPWGVHTTPLEAKAWDCGKEEAAEQGSEDCSEENGGCASVPPPRLSGTLALVPPEENLPLDADIQKWTVDDVHDFIRSLPGCSDYARIFKDHAIDGETLLLLREEHLRGTMGLKLGPALKIQSQISQHVRSMLNKKTLSLSTHTRQVLDQPADTAPLLDFNSWSDTLSIPCSQD
ncbi:sterile alpha motif domain-containing protein 7 [Heterocephalus glaber]|uniref:Sterile alpha motif domain-containing protein 7 n=1 Tax=Heterocephalus glaber TaxID=10181 RepID=A0AAX6NQB9_HETGA|nr:sterile alpha motif domain-containing protein 7 [Heterocephalus glaber]